MRIWPKIVGVLMSMLWLAPPAIAQNPEFWSECPEKIEKSDRDGIKKIAKCAAKAHNIPHYLVATVIEVESRFNANARGADGEVGLMQVMPPTANYLGFKGSLEELSDPKVNVRLGSKYLAGAYRLSEGDLCTTLMKYRAGHGETRFSELSVAYCRRARSILKRQGIEVTGVLPKATFGFRRIGRGRNRQSGGSRNCLTRSFVPGLGYGRCLKSAKTRSSKRIIATRRSIFD